MRLGELDDIEIARMAKLGNKGRQSDPLQALQLELPPHVESSEDRNGALEGHFDIDTLAVENEAQSSVTE